MPRSGLAHAEGSFGGKKQWREKKILLGGKKTVATEASALSCLLVSFLSF